MKSKTSRKPLVESKPISSWDDAVFDPADLVQDMQDLADHYEGEKQLTLRTFTRLGSGVPSSPQQRSLNFARHTSLAGPCLLESSMFRW